MSRDRFKKFQLRNYIMDKKILIIIFFMFIFSGCSSTYLVSEEVTVYNSTNQTFINITTIGNYTGNSSITINNLTGEGVAYVCVDENGTIFRSVVNCNLIITV